MALLHRWIKPHMTKSLLHSFVGKYSIFLMSWMDRIWMYGKNLGNYYFHLSLWLVLQPYIRWHYIALNQF